MGRGMKMKMEKIDEVCNWEWEIQIGTKTDSKHVTSSF